MTQNPPFLLPPASRGSSKLPNNIPLNSHRHSDETSPSDITPTQKSTQPLLPPPTVMLTILFAIILEWYQAFHNQKMLGSNRKINKMINDTTTNNIFKEQLIWTMKNNIMP